MILWIFILQRVSLLVEKSPDDKQKSRSCLRVNEEGQNFWNADVDIDDLKRLWKTHLVVCCVMKMREPFEHASDDQIHRRMCHEEEHQSLDPNPQNHWWE